MNWEAILARDAWTLFDAICYLLKVDPEEQIAPADRPKEFIRNDLEPLGLFAGGMTTIDAEFDPRFRYPSIVFTKEFKAIATRASESHIIGKLAVFGHSDDWYELYIEPRKWLEWAEGKFELPEPLKDFLLPPEAVQAEHGSAALDLQELANRAAATYMQQHSGRRPTKGVIAKKLVLQGYGSLAETVERKIRKRW